MVAVPPRPNLVRMCVALIAVVAAIGGYSMLPVEAQSNALPFARSFLLTGNYAVAGVDLLPQAADCTTFAPNCYAKGDITVAECPQSNPQPGSCIPAGADVVAAFMYWEAISLDPTLMPPAKFLGQTVTNAKRSDLTLPSEASCLSSGGALKLSMFSADVLRFFPLQTATGRRTVTGTHQVALPEVGNGNQARQGAGASIFFVYRTANDPLRKIVVYDGAYLQTPLGTVTSQTLQGFYQSSAAKSAWLTHIVGSGSKNETERIKFNGTTVADAVDPFKFPLGNQGGNGSDRAWSNPTYDVSSKMQPTTDLTSFGETATTEVDHTNNTPYECLSWAAVIFSTAVKDIDADGLPDGLEDAVSTLKDPDPVNPAGRDLPRLRAMGANKGTATSQKDIFIEMNAMKTPGASYGDAAAPFSTILDIDTVTDSVGHNHLPTPAVIKLLGDALKNAPTSIALHVDVGDIGDYKALGPDYKVNDADEYLVPTAEARGGELILETACPSNLQTTDPLLANSIGCHFPKFPGTVGWKFGFQHYRDQAVDGDDGSELNPTQEAECYVDGTYGNGPGTACRRRFDPIRADLFHYFLYAHAMGMPKGNPCLSGGVDVPYPVSGTASCGSLANNPDFHVPKSFSGVADFPGGGALITLGLWDMTKFVGSTFLQASTTMHELGHNLELSHAGKPPVFTATTATHEPNCKPNYPSIMSYLFQVNGLLDAAGNPHIDYSRKAYYDLANTTAVLNEAALYDGTVTGKQGVPLPDASLDAAFQYRTAWFVPITTGSVAEAIGIQPAGRFCGGESFGGTAPNPAMGRFDGPSLASAIDWKLDGVSSPSSSDANFDGAITAAYAGYDDWSSVRLDRLGGSKNPEGYSLGQGGFGYGQGGFGFGPGNFDFGQGGFGFGQGGFGFGQGGFGFGVGGFQLGDGAFGFGQGGFGFGQGGFGFGQGGFGFGQGGFGFGSDPDFDHVKKMGNLPPLSAKVCVIGGTTAFSCPSGTTGPLHRNRVTWAPPNAGKVQSYRVYRETSITGSSVIEQLCGTGATGIPDCPTGTSFVDQEELPNGKSFTYFVRAIFKSCNPATSTTPCLPDDCNPTVESCASGPSIFVTLTAENTPPVAVNDPQQGATYTTTPNSTLIIPAPGVLGSANQNDSDVDSPKTRIRVKTYSQPTSGSVVVDADGGFTYTASNGNPGTVTFTYQADDGFWRTTNILMSDPSNVATVTITLSSKTKK